MITFQYRVASIDGDYANLERIDAPGEGYKLVARARFYRRKLRRGRSSYTRCCSIPFLKSRRNSKVM